MAARRILPYSSVTVVRRFQGRGAAADRLVKRLVGVIHMKRDIPNGVAVLA